MAGRPTKFTAAIRTKLETAAALDATIEEMCFAAGIVKDTYYHWIADNPELSERLTELRNKPVLAARNTIVKAINNGDKAMSTWYLERKRKKEFAEQKQLTGADGQPLFDDQTKTKAKGAIASFFGN